MAELHKTKVRALFLIIIGLSAVPLAHGSTDFRCRDWRKLKSKSQRDRASLYIDGLWVGMNTSPLFESGCEGIREKLKLPRGKDIPDLVNEVFKICDLEKYSNLIVPPLIKPALMRLTGKQKEADFELQLQVDTAKDFPQTK